MRTRLTTETGPACAPPAFRATRGSLIPGLAGFALAVVCCTAASAGDGDRSRASAKNGPSALLEKAHKAAALRKDQTRHRRRGAGDGPPRWDPSHFGQLILDADGTLLEDLPDANHGSFEGGRTGHPEDAAEENVLPAAAQRDDGTFNVPTNGPPSPLFDAPPFTQQLLRFEEFGTRPLDPRGRKPPGWDPLPPPADARAVPDGGALERFLSQAIWPRPRKFSNTEDTNPWEKEIEAFLERGLDHPPAEGRPPGEGWSHQRWEEFKPEVYVQTAQTGARTNNGFRDVLQRHGYEAGEFGPGGLYHSTAGTPLFNGTTADVPVRFHPLMPEQDPHALWTFDGTFPPKLLNVRYGEPVLVRHYNALPIDVAANRGFGVHTLSTHEHNGHNPAESDGYTNAFFFPGQFYDYRWPMVLAGADSINTDATDPRAGAPDGAGGIKRVPGDWRETMSTHWFHDHMLDFTAQNVYKGNVAMMNYYSALDRGKEDHDDGVNLRLPSGTALDWGNRDYDVNLVLADKAWDRDGQLWFNPFNIKGFIGDVMTVNWLYKPYLDVRARRYRLRLLNGSVSRYFKLALVDAAGNPVPFHMVANDGNIMEHTVHFANGELPTQGVAERYDIVVDFSVFAPGDRIYMVNLLQHKDEQVTDRAIPLADVVGGAYAPRRMDDDDDGRDDRWVDGDPVVGAFLEFRVQEWDGMDHSMDPAEYVAGGKKMIPLRRPSEAELANAVHRTFEFEKQPTDDKPWVIETDGGKGFGMDPRRISAAPSKDSDGLEVWRILNSGNWSHPVHIHFEEGIILRRDGVEPPEWEKWARKDVYRIGPQPDSGDVVEIALRFREFAGTYMEHCHNTQHEDHAMLLRWDVEHPGQVKLMPTPIPTWDGVTYVDSVALPTFRDGDGLGPDGPPLDSVDVWNGAVIGELDAIRDEFLGDALNPNENNERGTATFALQRGVNVDAQGRRTPVWFFLHDVSDRELAGKMNLAWAGKLAETPPEASARARVQWRGGNRPPRWIFYGDLPNPVWANPPCRVSEGVDPASGEACRNPDGIPDVDHDNTYSPLRRVRIKGKEVVFNAIIVKWGEESWEQNRRDLSCVGFPDVGGPTGGANGTCAYNGTAWGRIDRSGHVVAMDTDGPQPSVTFKLHKSWGGDGDYLPYYIVLDTFPDGPARAMGVPYVPKHQYLAKVAVPLVQFVPGRRIHPTFPPMPQPATTDGGEGGFTDGFGIIDGGGPFGSQVGLPSYFMPEEGYSPMWHIGFAHWLEPASEVVRGFKRLKELRAEGRLEILEWPAPPRIAAGDADPQGLRVDDYDFENPASPHVVNCPTPMTIDRVVHEVSLKLRGIPIDGPAE